MSTQEPDVDIHSYVARHITLRYLKRTRTAASTPDADPPAPSKQPGDLKVAIIGAGVSGLYSAMILLSLGIPFKIFEATDKVGGRIFTHKFSDKPNDYFDVGAMRFPKIKVMQRLFQLFDTLNLNEKNGTLQKYVFNTDENRLLFNQINRSRGSLKVKGCSDDLFDAESLGVEQDFLDVAALQKDAVETFMKSLRDDLTSTRRRNFGWRKLMRFDDLSARAYLSVCKRLPVPAINWMETFGTSTGNLDSAFTDWVLAKIAFGADEENVEWKCLKGGSQVLPDRMEAWIKDPPPEFESPEWELKRNTLVTKIKALRESSKSAKAVTGMEITYSAVDASGKPGKPQTEVFDHVISTIPLPVFRTLDHDEAGLDNLQKSALRKLTYGPAVKVGMKFKTQWWSQLGIQGGQSVTDRPVRVVVYPSNGIDPEGEDPCNVLIASYAWAEDAERLSGLINSNKDPKEADERLKTLVLRDLAAVHPGITYEQLLDEYVAHFPWSWEQNPYSQGAFAHFGPGDFQYLYEELNQPAAGGKLHFAGEAMSIRHAWVVGALDTAWRAVRAIILLAELGPEVKKKFLELWPICRDWLRDAHDVKVQDAQSEQSNHINDLQGALLRDYVETHFKEFENTPFIIIRPDY